MFFFSFILAKINSKSAKNLRFLFFGSKTDFWGIFQLYFQYIFTYFHISMHGYPAGYPARCRPDTGRMPAGCRPDAGCRMPAGCQLDKAVHLNPPTPLGGDPWHSFSGFRIALGEGKGGGKQRCSNTPRDPRGVGGSNITLDYIYLYYPPRSRAANPPPSKNGGCWMVDDGWVYHCKNLKRLNKDMETF